MQVLLEPPYDLAQPLRLVGCERALLLQSVRKLKEPSRDATRRAACNRCKSEVHRLLAGVRRSGGLEYTSHLIEARGEAVLLGDVARVVGGEAA